MAFFIIVFLMMLFTFPSFIFSISIPIITPKRNISITDFKSLPLPPGVAGTGSLTFDLLNGGPYTGTVDGRILKYNKRTKTFRNFAYTSRKRTSEFCDGQITVGRADICGFPTGLSTDNCTGKIYTADTFLGVAEVGVSGGLATILVPTNADGVPYHTLLGIDAASNGKIFFADATSVYGPRDVNATIATGDSTGRVFEYDRRTKRVTELLSQLGAPTGVATTSDASILLVAEFNGKRIRKYYLEGEKAGTSEILLTFSGNPNKITRIKGEENFWVAVNYSVNETFVVPKGVKISSCGETLAKIDFSKEYNQSLSSVVQECDEIFVSSFNGTSVGKYKLVYS